MSNQIWTDAQLSQWANDAIGQIAQDVQCVFAREALTVISGVSVVTLPSYVRTLRRVTWRGKSLDCMNWEELCALGPGTVFVKAGSSANIETSRSRPLYYAMHPTNPYDIRFYPTPGESFIPSQISDVYAPRPNEDGSVIDYYRQPDTTGQYPIATLPTYIVRRTQKAYVLWKAYSSEGKGQDLKAASYYQMKYNFLIEKFRSINEGCFVSKKYSVDDGMLTIDGFRYPRPKLPSQFELVRF